MSSVVKARSRFGTIAKYPMDRGVPTLVAKLSGLTETRRDPLRPTPRALVETLDAFAAGDAVPGSGSANALVAALGACLTASVAVKTYRSAELKYISVKQTAVDVERQARFLSAELAKLFEDDSRVFAEVVAIRRDTGRKVDRILQDDAMRNEIGALKRATEIPISIATRALEVGRLSIKMLDTGFTPARGESYTALIQSIAAIDGALFVARVNLRTIRARTEKLNDPLLETPWVDARLDQLEGIRKSMLDLKVREQLARKDSESLMSPAPSKLRKRLPK